MFYYWKKRKKGLDLVNRLSAMFETSVLTLWHILFIAQSAGALEYTDSTSAEG